MILEKKKLDGFNVMGLSIRTSNEDGKAVDHINALWQMFSEQNVMNDIPERIDDTVYALYSDYEGEHTKPYKFTIGCAVYEGANIPEGMDLIKVPEQSYAVSKAIGDPPASIVKSWTDIWESDLKRAYKFDFEIYGQDFFNPQKRCVPIYVSIEEAI